MPFLRHRAANAETLLEMVSSGSRLFSALQARIDQSYASFQTERNLRLFEMSTKLLSRDELERTATSYQLSRTRLDNLDLALRWVDRSLKWFIKWRENIIKANGNKLDESVELSNDGESENEEECLSGTAAGTPE